MRLSVVVVNWNLKDDLASCLRSLVVQTHPDVEIVVVDNGSTDGSVAMVQQDFPTVHLLAESRNLGFAEACNRGIAATTGPWVALLNNDAIADSAWATELVRAAQNVPAACGMLQSLMTFLEPTADNPKGRVNSTGIELVQDGGGRDRGEGHPPAEFTESVEIFCPTAGAAAYRRTMLDAIVLPYSAPEAPRYFDPKHFMYYEDLDLGWRARLAGHTAQYVPTAWVEHRWHGSAHRHGRSWLMVVSRTNRIRTLLKNASWSFLLQVSPHVVVAMAEVLIWGKGRGALGLVRTIGESALMRRRLEGRCKVDRRDLEKLWVVS